MKRIPSCKIPLKNKGLKVLRALPLLSDRTAVAFSVLQRETGGGRLFPQAACG